MTTPNPANDIPPLFVSHSHLDNNFCRPFVAHLRTALGLAVDPARLFYDERALHAGDDWITIIQREVMARPLFVVILTPHSVEAPYVQQETNLAIRLTTGNPTRRLFGLLVEPCDPAQLAPLLLNYQLVDMVKRGYDAAFDDLVAAIRAAAQGQPPTVGDGARYVTPTTPPAPDPRLARARELAAEARDALKQNLLADAIAKADSALERFAALGTQISPGERADALVTLADACGRAGQWPRALDAAQRGRQEDPDRLDCYLFQAAAQRELNLADQAQQTLDMARAVVPLSDAAQRLRFLAAQRALDASQQQWQRALATVDEEQRLAPTDAALATARLDLLGHWRAALSGQQQWMQALAVLDQELSLAPNDPARLGALLDLLQRDGQAQPALTLARQLTAQPNASAAQWLARAQLARQVDGDQADQEVISALDAAARLTPSDPAIVQARAELLPPTFAPNYTTPRLASLGFAPRVVRHEGKWAELILPPLCSVPAGPFRMGSDPQQDSGTYDQEKPQHEVTLAAFQIARFPVTVAEYACYQRATGNAAATDKLDHPVVNVSWHDATAYAAWLAQLTGQPWRLPSEAEWEKAARFDPATRASRIYPWGDAFDKSRANTSEGSKGGATPVGSYPSGASPCGAQDMAGNVWEWTSSLFKPYPYTTNDGRERADSTENRVLRGGSWYYFARLARAAYRYNLRPDLILDLVGFRVVCAVPGS